jgi:hypothetical protein
MKYYGMKTFGGVEIWLPAFLTLALDIGDKLASLYIRFVSKKRASNRPHTGNDAARAPYPVWTLYIKDNVTVAPNTAPNYRSFY